MRLKFLFFPVVLIISVSIFIGYIWPEIDNIKNINTEKIANAQSLQAIKDKQSAIESINTQITNNGADKTMVNNYLPDKKVEERIISGINYLAVDSGVSLVNVSIKNLDNNNSANEAQQNIVAENSINGDQISSDADKLQFSEATISISGDYEKIKLFIDQLQKIALLNDIKSLTISNQKESSNTANSTDTSISSTLSADMIVDFGYMHFFSLNNNKITNFKPEIDNDTISALKQYILQKTESTSAMISSTGNKGKANPFLP